jgi:hypothetical protein
MDTDKAVIEICWEMFALWAAGNPAYAHLPVQLWEALRKADPARYDREFDQAVFGRKL